jgi:hypothetical protein
MYVPASFAGYEDAMKIVTGQIASIAGIPNSALKENGAARSVASSHSDTVQFETSARYLEAAMRDRSLDAISACIAADTYSPAPDTVAHHLVTRGFDS